MLLACALMTLKSMSKVRRLHKNSIKELGSAIMTLKSKTKVGRMQNREEWSWDAH